MTADMMDNPSMWSAPDKIVPKYLTPPSQEAQLGAGLARGWVVGLDEN